MKVVPFKSRPWQEEALRFVMKQGPQFNKKQVIAACGSGKTWFSKTIIEHNSYYKILILVPNLHLLSQWFELMASWLPERSYCLVGSDINKNDVDIPFILSTKTDRILDFNYIYKIVALTIFLDSIF